MTDGLKEAYKDAQKHAQDKIMITCCKCHGKGSYNALNLVSEDGDMMVNPEPSTCELCKGTGKISLQFYEDLQRGVRKR